MAKKLVVFDFDHTVVDDNSDIVVRRLLKNEQIPNSVRALYQTNGWTVYMQEIFKLLKNNHISERVVKNAIINIPPVTAMEELITTMVTKMNFDAIIVSDANSLFINEWLVAHNLKQFVHTVFTNPAKYNNGLLEIEMYHVQQTCKLSTVNLCKGIIMEDFVRAQCKVGVNYNQIVYVGDGKNDYCPCLRLKNTDVACARAGYALSEIIKKPKSKEDLHIIAKICIWKNGLDILKSIT